MIIKTKDEFIEQIRSFKIDTKYVVVKPNWVNNTPGQYTEPEILDWLFESLPQEKIVVESYIPWRGKEYKGGELGVGLESGKQFWDFYRAMDEEFLENTGIGKVLSKHNANYLNITNEYWGGKTVASDVIKNLVERKSGIVEYNEFYSFIPTRLWEIKEDATLISLAKVKLEEENVSIVVSLSIKNLFGLIPHPSRRIPYHEDNHVHIPRVISDINKIYNALFPKSLWINEGIKTMVKHYCEKSEIIENNKGLFFAGTDPIKTDSETCTYAGVDPRKVPYLNQ